MSNRNRLLVKGAEQLVLICSQRQKFLTRQQMTQLCVIQNGSLVIGR